MRIHWCGTGLSAVPGLRRLIQEGHNVKVWNRTLETAQSAVGDLTHDIVVFDADQLFSELRMGDVVVSMLPGDFHALLAQLCIEKGAHFVSSSYISPPMRALDEKARHSGVVVINEVGLDPGIDHLMAHWLVNDYRNSDAYSAPSAHSFKSYCGGIPKHPNAFRYKFSWSPFGVLKALLSPSRSIRDFSQLDIARPWDALGTYSAPLDIPEIFEVYPNRDSLPFMGEYGFGDDWKVKEFVRGTLRLNGWADAWNSVFEKLCSSGQQLGDDELRSLSDELWQNNKYGEEEPDRVVLCVDLLVEAEGIPTYHKTYVLDAWGDDRGTAMARLVSMPVSLAVNAIINREIKVGVQAAPSDQKNVNHWLSEIDVLAQRMQVVDHLA